MSRLLISLVFLWAQLHTELQVQGDPNPEPDASPGPIRSKGFFSKPLNQELLTRYLLSRLLGQKDKVFPQSPAGDRREDQATQASDIFPLRSAKDPLQKLLDHAKANIDVIDFRNPDEQYFEEDHLRFPRQPEGFPPPNSEASLDYDEAPQRSLPSDTVPIFLPFPGTETSRTPRQSQIVTPVSPSKFKLPVTALGKKDYYIGMFFKANWFRAEQYCRFHGMHLASVNSAEEQKNLEEHITSFGMGNEHFWSSGTDLAEEGKFFWMATGKPLTYENWNAGEPNNFKYENGEGENCLELWNRDGKGLKWNDTPCSFESYFVCEA